MKSRGVGLFSPRKVAPNPTAAPKGAPGRANPATASGGVPMWSGAERTAVTPRLSQLQAAAATPSPAGRKAPGSSHARGRTPKTAHAGRAHPWVQVNVREPHT